MNSAQSVVSRTLVATDRAPRYGKQLIGHLGRHLETSWDEDTATGVVRFEHGLCDLTSSAEGLLLALEIDPGTPAVSEQVARMEDVIGRHLVRFGARDELVASWVRSDGTPGSTQRVNAADDATPATTS